MMDDEQLISDVLFLLHIFNMISQKGESTSRIPSLRKLLTEQLIEELLVKYILNIDDKQQHQNRIVFHFKLAYYYFLHMFKLHSHSSDSLLRQEEIFFMGKLNEYLPDFLRLEAYCIEEIHQNFRNIPVYGAIISRNNKREYLLVQDRRTGKYGFCKGKISEGETPQECVKREVREQLGLRIQFSKFCKEVPIIIKQRQLLFIESKLEQGYHSEKQIVYEGHNHHHEIKKSVWWSTAKIKEICRKNNREVEKLNSPTFLVFKTILR